MNWGSASLTLEVALSLDSSKVELEGLIGATFVSRLDNDLVLQTLSHSSVPRIKENIITRRRCCSEGGMTLPWSQSFPQASTPALLVLSSFSLVPSSHSTFPLWCQPRIPYVSGFWKKRLHWDASWKPSSAFSLAFVLLLDWGREKERRSDGRWW